LKLIEALILDDVKSSLKRLHPSQTGFTENSETGVNLIKVLSKLRSIQSKKGTSNKHFLSFIDLRAAFDKVNHERVVNKARAFGIGENALNIIQLLYNHTSLRIGKEQINVNSGVPQGLLISPFLFNIYIDDLLWSLARLIGDDNVFAFADDLLYVTCGPTETEGAESLLDKWCAENYMEVNDDKSKVLVLCKKKGIKTLNIKKIGKYEIVEQYKYLGIVIDCSLTLDGYISQLKSKLESFEMNIPKILINTVSLKIRLELWKVFAASHLSYACGILAVLPAKIKAFEIAYMKTLKRACKLHITTETKAVLRTLDVQSPKTAILASYCRLLRKIYAKRGSLPKSMEEQWESYARSESVPLDLLAKTKGEILKAIEDHNARITGVEPTKVQTLSLQDILVTGDMRDSYLVKFLTGGILSLQKYRYGGRYNIQSNDCLLCGTLGDQRHFVESCTLSEPARTVMLEEMRTMGVTIDRPALFDFIREMKYQKVWKGLKKENRARLLDLVKDYVLTAHTKLKETVEKYKK